MGKTVKGKDKAKAKIAKAKAKIARKTKRGIAAIVAAFALAFLFGCSTSDSAQPAKSQTQNNTFDGCVFVMAANATVSNGVVVAAGEAAPALEMFTQTQSLESTGSTDTFSQTATQTPTTDVKPDVDLHYNDAVGKGGDAVSTFLSSLTTEGMAAVKAAIASKQSGKITVTKQDGTTETLDCVDGTCTTSGGLTINSENCESCTVK